MTPAVKIFRAGGSERYKENRNYSKRCMMKQSIASRSARAWNQKNLPSDLERFEESPKEGILGQVSSAAADIAQTRRGVLILSLAAMAVVSLVWFLYSNND